MYQDLSFMNVPLPEDILKLKIYGDYAGAQKMIHYFLEEKDIPQALRKRLEIEQEVIGVMGGNEYLIKTRPDFAKRVIVENPENNKENNLNQKLLNENIHYMKEHGGRTVHTRIRSTIKVKKEFEEVGRKVRVHLPEQCILRLN